MDHATDALIMQTDEAALMETARDILRIYDGTLAGDIRRADANEAVFAAIVRDVAAAALVYQASVQTGVLRGPNGEALETLELSGLIAQIEDHKAEFTAHVAPWVSQQTDIETYLRQMAALNDALLSLGVLRLSEGQNLAEEFRYYQSIVAPLEQALGYTDFAAARDRDAYWPSAEFFQSHYKFINLFRSSDSERAKSLAFMAFFDGLSRVQQIAAYAWVYDANFETFLAVAPVPSDLPPWIKSDALRALHRTINDVVMAEFEDEELEMME